MVSVVYIRTLFYPDRSSLKILCCLRMVQCEAESCNACVCSVLTGNSGLGPTLASGMLPLPMPRASILNVNEATPRPLPAMTAKLPWTRSPDDPRFCQLAVNHVQTRMNSPRTIFRYCFYQTPKQQNWSKAKTKTYLNTHYRSFSMWLMCCTCNPISLHSATFTLFHIQLLCNLCYCNFYGTNVKA